MNSRERIKKIIAKASLSALVVAGVFGAPTAHAFRNYSEYAAACRAEGGTPSPSPARCDIPSNRGNTNSGYDYGAARRAQEAAEAAAAAERQRQAEAERIERERLAEEKRQKDAAFIRDRDAAANSLKGSSGLPTSHLKGISGTELRGSGDNPYGLRDAVSDKGLKGSTPASDARVKQIAAWKQVHCAASIAKYALAALQTKGDYDEFGTLSVEASKALDGQRTSVECGQAPAFPNLNGKTVNMDRVIVSERQLLSRATVVAERMKQRGDIPAVSSASAKTTKETPEETMRRVQRELNQANSQKITGRTQQEIDQQERDRKELARLILVNSRLEKGELTSVSVDTQEEAAPRPRRTPVSAPQ